MTTDFTSTGISHLQAVGLKGGGPVRIAFRSTNDGWYHQLYANGILVDVTESAEQRELLLDRAYLPSRLTVMAVEPELREEDLTARPPHAPAAPPWVYRVRVPQPPSEAGATRIAVHGDHARGQLDPTALASRLLSPPFSPSWGWGHAPLGEGGFGLDAAAAPGLGGAFGAGPFGAGTQLTVLAAALAEDGTHHLEVRSVGPDGQHEVILEEEIEAHPPPPSPSSLRAVAYDNENQTLTLEIV